MCKFGHRTWTPSGAGENADSEPCPDPWDRNPQAGAWGRGPGVSRAPGLALISGNTGRTPSIVCTYPPIYASPHQPHSEDITPARCLARAALPGKAKCDGRRGGLSPESVTANFYHCPSPDATTKGRRLASPRGKVRAHNYPVIVIRENPPGPATPSSTSRLRDLGRVTSPRRDHKLNPATRDGNIPADLILLGLSPTLPATPLNFIVYFLDVFIS